MKFWVKSDVSGVSGNRQEKNSEIVGISAQISCVGFSSMSSSTLQRNFLKRVNTHFTRSLYPEGSGLNHIFCVPRGLISRKVFNGFLVDLVSKPF